MFNSLTRFAVFRWPVVLAATLLFAILGYRTFQMLPIEAFPDVTNPMVEVVGVYPGQSAEEVEKRVTLELERVLASTPKLINLRSVSVFGLSLLTLTFSDDSVDMKNRAQVSERLRDAELPQNAQASMGPQATPVGQIYRYTLRGNRSLRELRAIQDFVVERRLQAVDGVADVVTFGGYKRQYQLRIDPARLAAAGVSVGQVHESKCQCGRWLCRHWITRICRACVGSCANSVGSRRCADFTAKWNPRTCA
jgi:heavy metal efflux system protein